MDPLTVLRDFIVNKEMDQVEERDGKISFAGRYEFDASALTAYKSSQEPKIFYDLGTLLLFSRHLHMKNWVREYRKTAKDRNVQMVRMLDTGDLRAYLTGAKATSDNIVPGGPAGLDADMMDAEGVGEAGVEKRRSLGGETDLAAGGASRGEVATRGEDVALRAILANERQLRDRNTMLTIPGRSLKRVLDILEGTANKIAAHAKREEARRWKRQKEEAARANAQVVQPRSSGRYDRETAADAALRDMGAGALGLQQVGFGGSELEQQPRAAVPPPPQAPPPSSSAAKPQGRTEKRDERHSKPSLPSKRHHMRLSTSSPASVRPAFRPVILVPPATTKSLVNILNAPKFLESGSFVPPQDAGMSTTTKRPERVRVERMSKTGKKVKYDISDREPRDKRDWDRVVAVICLGKPWQFRNWPFPGADKGDLVQTFNRVCGIYLHYADEPIDPTVKQWNVRTLGLQRHNRDGDGAVARELWSHLDSFLQARRPELKL